MKTTLSSFGISNGLKGTFRSKLKSPKFTLFATVILNLFVPIGIAMAAVGIDVIIDQATHGIIVSVFSIVSALLFGALFSIFSAASSIDRTKLAREFKNLAAYKRDLKVINRWVIYLVALSTVCVFVTLIFYLVPIPAWLETLVLLTLISHFFLVFFPLLKRVFDFLELAYRKI